MGPCLRRGDKASALALCASGGRVRLGAVCFGRTGPPWQYVLRTDGSALAVCASDGQVRLGAMCFGRTGPPWRYVLRTDGSAGTGEKKENWRALTTLFVSFELRFHDIDKGGAEFFWDFEAEGFIPEGEGDFPLGSSGLTSFWKARIVERPVLCNPAETRRL